MSFDWSGLFDAVGQTAAATSQIVASSKAAKAAKELAAMQNTGGNTGIFSGTGSGVFNAGNYSGTFVDKFGRIVDSVGNILDGGVPVTAKIDQKGIFLIGGVLLALIIVFKKMR